MQTMRYPIRLLAVCLLSFMSCTSDPVVRSSIPDPQVEKQEVLEQVTILEESGKKDDAASEVAVEQAVTNLIERGVRIEPQLIDLLSSTNSSTKRMGLIHVLNSIGTGASTEAMIACMNDSDPKIVLMADVWLNKQHPSAKSIVETMVPPMPTDDNMESLKTYCSLHANRRQIAWSTWWKTSGPKKSR
jgi:hypothetical protein